MLKTTVFFRERNLCLLGIGNARASGKSLAVFLLSASLFVSARAFVWRRLCFWGARRLVMMFCRVFAASRNLAHQFSVLGLFWARSRHQFPGFFASWTYFLNFRAPTGLLFFSMDPQGHTFAPLGAARPATRPQTGSPSRFLSLPPGQCSGNFLVFFAFFTGLSDFGKTETPR